MTPILIIAAGFYLFALLLVLGLAKSASDGDERLRRETAIRPTRRNP